MHKIEERYASNGPVRLWTDRTGDPAHPALLLIAGQAAQSVAFPDELVGALAGRGVQVIRFDHRDTGRSTVIDFDAHPYAMADMGADCLAVLDEWGLESAAVAGFSMGGMIAQWLGVHAPGRVRALTLVTTSPMGHDQGPAWLRAMAGEPPEPGELPPPTAEFRAYVTAGLAPGVEYDMELFRIFTGPAREFDAAGARASLELAASRVTEPAAAANHGRAGRTFAPDRLAPLSSITAPVTVLHGDHDPVFPLEHGEALAAAIPGAELRVVPGMGHVFFSPGLHEEIAGLIRL